MPTMMIKLGAVAALGVLAVALNSQFKFHWLDKPGNAAASHSMNKLGYLAPGELPNLVALLPPPPEPGTPAMARDEKARRDALLLKTTRLYAIAKADAVRAQPNTVAGFECAFGTTISTERTPALYKLLSRVRLDVRAASYAAKSQFARPRPFVLNRVHSCYPDDEDMVRDDGSYPSARGSVGWAYAIVLAGLRPDRREAIMERAQQFAQSRVICDQEWQSDVDAARTVGLAVVTRERAEAAFKADLVAARKEVAAELALGVGPSAVCTGHLPKLASR